ncbi:hypothetical protein [Methyloprofundus sp.]|uniref:hypothetical protein n=1 Tax=Methyloprofundus sp. TaxID=2020875 RepID=UPI003D122F7E
MTQDFGLTVAPGKQALSWLRNYCYSADDGQKDQQGWMIICSRCLRLSTLRLV